MSEHQPELIREEPTSVEEYEFEPIKGYPMLNWRGKRPFTSTQYYSAQLKEVHGPEVPNVSTKTGWECGRGYQWEALYKNIKKGSGCPLCARWARKEHDILNI